MLIVISVRGENDRLIEIAREAKALAVDLVKLNETDVLKTQVTGPQRIGYNQIVTCKF